MSSSPSPAPIYLDYAATTPVDPRVAECMLRHLAPGGVFANPASMGHALGRSARAAVERARAQVAGLIGARPEDIVWTSGATEAINLALKGVCRGAPRGRHLVTTCIEHPAVLDVCRVLEGEGFAVTRLAPGPDGLLEPARLEAALREDTVLVSVMHVNNEIGVAQNLAAIGRLAHAGGALLHVDAAQSVGKLPLDVEASHIDLMSLTAHKVYGPKGIGALYVRREVRPRLVAQIHGGGQEQGLRAGTLATHQIVGMGEALAVAGADMPAEDRRIRSLRERLGRALTALPGVHRNGAAEPSVAGILNLRFQGLDAEDLMLALQPIALSAGSACASGAHEPSHVLRAIGLSDEQASTALRFSVGRFTTEAEIDTVIETVSRAVPELRGARRQ